MKGLGWVAPRGPTRPPLSFSSASMQLSGARRLGAVLLLEVPGTPFKLRGYKCVPSLSPVLFSSTG